MECPLNREEMALWKRDPLNSRVLKAAAEYRQSLRESLGAGRFLHLFNLEQTGLATAQAVGICKGLSEIIDMEARDNEQRDTE